MLRIPLWKLVLSFLICFLSIYLSIPTFVDLNKYGLESFFPDKKVNLGLDLRGGSYLLIEAKMNSYQADLLAKNIDTLQSKLKAEKDLQVQLSTDSKGITAKFINEEAAGRFKKLVKDNIGSFFVISSQAKDSMRLNINEDDMERDRKNMIQQSIEIIRRRVDETGTKEVDLQRQGDNYILLQVPGVEHPDQLKRIIGKTAKMTFHLVDSFTPNPHEKKLGTKLLPIEEKDGSFKMISVQSIPFLTGDRLVDAQPSVRDGQPVVNLRMDTNGAKIFANVTAKNIGTAFAIVLDNLVISAPVIRESIPSGNGQISGNFTIASAGELALLLRAGALPVPLEIVEERSVGPSLGLDSIKAGSKAVILGFVLVVLFMFIFYYFFGMIANLALIFNFFLIISVLALFGATLTMPGIAGIVLTLGMAVDANVLIFERIREELHKGRSALSAIESGYHMAFNTIFDSNITTIIAGVILYLFGAGPIKGFAVTMVVGILCSMFTAVTLSKIIVALWYKNVRPKTVVI